MFTQNFQMWVFKIHESLKIVSQTVKLYQIVVIGVPSLVSRRIRSEEFIKLQFLELFASVKVSNNSKSGVLQQA